MGFRAIPATVFLPFSGKFDFSVLPGMVGGYASQSQRGSAMSGKSTPGRAGKKAPQLSLKEKRAAKRAKNAPDEFLKPRKGAKS